jgi:hypothetical protein
MCYMFRPNMANFRQHNIKDSTTQHTLSTVLLKHVALLINVNVIGCMFPIAAALCPIGRELP